MKLPSTRFTSRQQRHHGASFRDPAGYVFEREGEVYRAINAPYFSAYHHLQRSGLYDQLVQAKLLVSHTLVAQNERQLVIKPSRIPFLSYPCEWSFSMLKEAAQLHLRINMLALEHGMLLKDASSYNVQFVGSRAVFIDTLSFAPYLQDRPWYAFGQFCRHFVVPLLLMRYCAPDINRQLTSALDGIPLAHGARLLPFRTRFLPFVQSTVHRHAAAVDKHKKKSKNAKLSRKLLRCLFTYLRAGLSDLQLPAQQTPWGDYYDDTSYPPVAFKEKGKMVRQWLREINAARVLDIGGNNGFFSRDYAADKDYVITCDNDPLAVEHAQQHNQQRSTQNVLSLLLDITNPTPAYGFANNERTSFLQRIGTASISCSLALAVLHHLCISHQCRFHMLAELFAATAPYLIIEFVDRQDTRTATLLAHMRDNYHAFAFYHRDNFVTQFEKFFVFIHQHRLTDTHRTLYLMRARRSTTIEG